VTLVDADLSGRRCIGELIDGIRSLNANRSHSVSSATNVGGVHVVELLDKYDDVYALRPSDLEALADDVSSTEGIALIDAGRPFSEHVQPLVARASRAIVVLEPNMLGTAATRTTVRDLVRFGIPSNRIWLVTNGRRQKAEIAIRELERIFGVSVVAEIPADRDRGYDKTIDALAKRLVDAPPEPPFANLRRTFITTASPIESSYGSNGSSNGTHVRDGGVGEPIVALDAAEPEGGSRRERNERRNRIRHEISEAMVSRVDLIAATRGQSDGEKISRLRDTIDSMISELLQNRTDIGDLDAQDRSELKQEIIDEQLGLGPLEDLMRDPAVSEIMVNGPKRIYVERGGKLVRSDRVFNDDHHVRLVIERIVAPLGRRIDESSPMVDARLPDGSRVNAIIAPLSLKGATLTIRRFGKKRLGIEDLVRFNSLPPEAVNLLRAMVESRLNILVSGGTGTGKTTFLNILSNFIPEDERIVTIEDAAELLLQQDHVVSLESRPANIEGKGSVPIRDLVKNALRMRPDRIVVGECRGGEALDMLQAMNTGHDGSLTTLHANTPRDALARLETLVLMAGFDLPIRAIREQIASAIDGIVQIERMRDGTRKVVSVTEVVGMEGEVVTLQELIRYQSQGLDVNGKVQGAFQYTGVQPHYTTRFEESGVRYDARELTKMEMTTATW